MKVLLTHRDADLQLERALPPQRKELVQDLELELVFRAMAAGDQFLYDVAERVVLSSLTDPTEIEYRQDVLSDCITHPEVVRQIYDLALEAIRREKREYWGLFTDRPDTVLRRSLVVLKMFISVLRRLRGIADEHADGFQSPGFRRFFAMVVDELDDQYLAALEARLSELNPKSGVLMSAQLGQGHKGQGYVLRKPGEQGWLGRLGFDRSGFTFQIPDRDEAGSRALSELEARGVSLAANALAQSSDHILSFFTVLLSELAFYIGAVNLHDRLVAQGQATSFPVPGPPAARTFEASDLCDVGLALSLGSAMVGNDAGATGKSLVMITGANQGGKSTFLRSVGVAQLMLQCGMFVAARSLRASVCEGVFTHFKREEDATMTQGKLDEELSRMSEIADYITPGCVLLCNESLAATNEREGSEIARQIIDALTEAGIRVVFVTHLYDLAHGFYEARNERWLFLRAGRTTDGGRTYKLLPGEPLPTSHGEDTYRRVFGQSVAGTAAGSSQGAQQDRQPDTDQHHAGDQLASVLHRGPQPAAELQPDQRESDADHRDDRDAQDDRRVVGAEREADDQVVDAQPGGEGQQTSETRPVPR
jgi:MutS domain V